jgi:hypothetical protein
MKDVFLFPHDLCGISGLLCILMAVGPASVFFVSYAIYKVWKTKRCPVSAVVTLGAVIVAFVSHADIRWQAFTVTIPIVLGLCVVLTIIEVIIERDKQHVPTAIAAALLALVTWLWIVLALAAAAV